MQFQSFHLGKSFLTQTMILHQT